MACFFDVKKCFDFIDHKSLLKKLAYYGFRNVSHKWFTNYLHLRKQYVASNGRQSSHLSVSTGVPQGSALGPLLFLIFINDFPQHIKHSSCNMFADDCCVYLTGKSLNETKSLFQNSVNDACKWYKTNHLPINTDKSLCMLAGSEHMLNRLDEHSKSLKINIDNVNLKQVSDLPYLGINLDDTLKWNKHILQLCSNISRTLGLLSRLRKVLNKDTLKLLYFSIILPKFDYAISVWGYCSNTNQKLIVRLQHRAARIVTNNWDFINVRGNDLVKELGWQTVEERRNYFTAMLLYKCINGAAPRRLIDELVMTTDTHEINTRSTTNGSLQVPEPNYELFRNSLLYQGSSLWNSLPSLLRNAPDILSFKKLYKSHFF